MIFDEIDGMVMVLGPVGRRMDAATGNAASGAIKRMNDNQRFDWPLLKWAGSAPGRRATALDDNKKESKQKAKEEEEEEGGDKIEISSEFPIRETP